MGTEGAEITLIDISYVLLKSEHVRDKNQPANHTATLTPLAAPPTSTHSELPLYNGDIEAAGPPESVTKFWEALKACNAFLIATPEFNFGMAGTD